MYIAIFNFIKTFFEAVEVNLQEVLSDTNCSAFINRTGLAVQAISKLIL